MTEKGEEWGTSVQRDDLVQKLDSTLQLLDWTVMNNASVRTKQVLDETVMSYMSFRTVQLLDGTVQW